MAVGNTLQVGQGFRSAGISKARATRKEATITPLRVVLAFALHVPLALLIRESEAVGQLHSLGTLALGIFWLISGRTAHRVPYVAAYLVGAELMWRMTGANILHEYGKYGASLLLLLALIRQAKLGKANKAIMVYFLLLLPSMALTFPTEGWASLERRLVSFYMSGPFLLTVSVMYFSTVRYDVKELRQMLLALMLPIFASAILALDSTLAIEGPVERYTEAVAGGYGNNQVSSIFGLGMLAAALFAVTEWKSRWFRYFIVAVGLYMAFQALVTMSRGGFLTGVGAIAVAAYYLVRSKRLFATVLLGGAALFFIGQYTIVPLANDLTDGFLERRYEEFTEEGDTSGRDGLSVHELKLFAKNPVFGVGPGGGEMNRLLTWGAGKASHTELTRLPAEHGIFGIAALMILFVLTVHRTLSLRRRHVLYRAISVSFMAWAVAFSLHAAMRLAAPAFLFGLAFATFLVDDIALLGRRKSDRSGDSSGRSR